MCIYTTHGTNVAQFQSAESLGVRWPPLVWKKLARFPCTLDDYCSSVDASARNFGAVAVGPRALPFCLSCSTLTHCSHTQSCKSQQEFDASYEDAFTFSGLNSASQQVALIPGGELVPVTFANREDFTSRLTAMRLGEIDAQWYAA